MVIKVIIVTKGGNSEGEHESDTNNSSDNSKTEGGANSDNSDGEGGANIGG